MKATITEVKSRIEIIREIQPFSIENVIEEKDVVDSKVQIAKHSTLWQDHQKEHPDARLQLIGVSEGGLFDERKYALNLGTTVRTPLQEAKKEVKTEEPSQKKQVILAGCNCGMIVEIGSNKKGEGYVKTYESSGLHTTANEYGMVAGAENTGYGSQSNQSDQANNIYKDDGAGYKG